MQSSYSLHNRKTQSTALFILSGWAIKTFADMRQMLCGNTWPLVANGDTVSCNLHSQ